MINMPQRTYFQQHSIFENRFYSLKGQLQRFHKLSLFDRFRYVENGLDINF